MVISIQSRDSYSKIYQ